MPKRAGRGTAVFEIFDHWHGLRHACGGEPARQSMIDSSKSNIGLGTCNQRLFSAIVRVSARLQNQWQTCSRLPPIFVQSFEIITESLMVYFSTHACFSPPWTMCHWSPVMFLFGKIAYSDIFWMDLSGKNMRYKSVLDWLIHIY